MKLFTLIILTVSFSVAYSSVAIAYNKTDPAHPGKCVTNGLILSPGEEGKPEGYCVRIMCGDKYGFVKYHMCGTTKVDPPCTVGDALYPEELYPTCCDMEIICPEGVRPTGFRKTG